MKQENEIFAVLIFIICSRAELKRCSEVRQEMFPHNLQLLPKSFLLSLSRFLFNNTKNLPMISIEIVFQSTMNSSRERVKECPRSCLDDKFLHKNDTKRRNRNVPHRKIYGLFLLDLFVVSQRAGKCDPVEGFTDNNDMVACSCCVQFVHALTWHPMKAKEEASMEWQMKYSLLSHEIFCRFQWKVEQVDKSE